MKTKYVTEQVTRTTISIEDGPIVELPMGKWFAPKIQVTGMIVTHTHGQGTRVHFWGQSINADGKPGKVKRDSDIFISEGAPLPDWVQGIMDVLWKGGDNVDL